jgi:hypothetical protein
MAHLSGHIENVNEVVEHDVSTEELLPHLWDTKLVTEGCSVAGVSSQGIIPGQTCHRLFASTSSHRRDLGSRCP